MCRTREIEVVILPPRQQKKGQEQKERMEEKVS
jgi:hypothetical protein